MGIAQDVITFIFQTSLGFMSAVLVFSFNKFGALGSLLGPLKIVQSLYKTLFNNRFEKYSELLRTYHGDFEYHFDNDNFPKGTESLYFYIYVMCDNLTFTWYDDKVMLEDPKFKKLQLIIKLAISTLSEKVLFNKGLAIQKLNWAYEFKIVTDVLPDGGSDHLMYQNRHPQLSCGIPEILYKDLKKLKYLCAEIIAAIQ